MKTALKLEERGRLVRHRYLRKFTGNEKPWVARIVGTCDRYGLDREFVRPHRDYRDASISLRSGLYHWYFLDDGYYEIRAVLSCTRRRRYFARVVNGLITEVEREEVVEWANNHGDER